MTHESEIKYPCLMEGYELIVCFSSYGVGHVVDSVNLKKYPVGYFSNNWIMEEFKQYEQPPKEPMYEYLVVYGNTTIGNYISALYYTEEEAKKYYGEQFVELCGWTKRERK